MMRTWHEEETRPGLKVPIADQPRTSSRATAEVMEQIAQLAYRFGFAGDLRPAQWTALRFFGRAEERACTVSAFAEHNLTSRSSASQTVNALVKRGLLVRRPIPSDRRTHRLELTDQAKALLANDPLRELELSITEMSDGNRFQLAERLEELLRLMLKRHAKRKDVG